MCEFLDRIGEIMPIMFGKSVNELFPPYVQARFSYHSIMEGHCPVCGKALSHYERRPPGRASRSLCQRCFNQFIMSRINQNCFICGGHLSPEKTYAQNANPREIRDNIHEGDCLDYFTLIHCKVVGGVDMSFIRDESYAYPHPSWQTQSFLPVPPMEPEAFESEIVEYGDNVDYLPAPATPETLLEASSKVKRALENALRDLEMNLVAQKQQGQSLTTIRLPGFLKVKKRR